MRLYRYIREVSTGYEYGWGLPDDFGDIFRVPLQISTIFENQHHDEALINNFGAIFRQAYMAHSGAVMFDNPLVTVAQPSTGTEGKAQGTSKAP